MMNIPRADWFEPATALVDKQFQEQTEIEYADSFSYDIQRGAMNFVGYYSLPEGVNLDSLQVLEGTIKEDNIEFDTLIRQNKTENDGSMIMSYDESTFHTGQKEVYDWYQSALKLANTHKEEFEKFCQENNAYDQLPQLIYDKTLQLLAEECDRLMNSFAQCVKCSEYVLASDLLFGGECENCSGLADYFR